MCYVNYSVFFLRISFYIYACLVCLMQLRKTQRGVGVWWCYCILHFVVEVKVSCIFVERNITYRYEYHFIRKCCVFHKYVNYCSWQWTLDTGIVTPWDALRGTGKEEGNFLGFQEIQCGIFIKLQNRYMTTYSCAIQPISSARVHKLPQTDSCDHWI